MTEFKACHPEFCVCGRDEGAKRTQDWPYFLSMDSKSLCIAALRTEARKRKLKILFLLVLVWPALQATAPSPVEPAPLDIGSRLELFVDRYLIEKLDGTHLKLHQPQPAGAVLLFDQPWEGAFSGYVTVLQDGPTYRMYYRGLPSSGSDESSKAVTCYAGSRDGIHWEKPKLVIHQVGGSRSNNVVLADNPPFSHNFSPFLDTRPGVSAQERYKALAGTSKSGLFVFVSADGLSWKKWRDSPVLTQGAFDSQNVAFWSEAENCYVAYFRTWTGGGFKGYRTISRAHSTDLVTWSQPEQMTFGASEPEHLYTSQTHPYFRAPHIYLALPMRFVPGCRVLTEEEVRQLGVGKGYDSDCAETVFMSSRGGNSYERTFMEGFIRPGLDPGNWASRSGLSALGIVSSGSTEISIYKQAHYAQPSNRLERYTLRTDGFVSVHAPFAGGEMRTKPLHFSGDELVLNFSTGAAGSVRVELQDPEGNPIPGLSLDDCTPLIGDSIARPVLWKKPVKLAGLAGGNVRLRFVMKDSDLYSIRFRESNRPD